MSHVYAVGDEKYRRHITHDGITTLCGLEAGRHEPLTLPANCGECRSSNGGRATTQQTMFNVSDAVGMTYVAAARALYATGEYTAFRVMEQHERPANFPALLAPGDIPRTWVLLWMDDDDAINPNVVAAETYEIGGEQS